MKRVTSLVFVLLIIGCASPISDNTKLPISERSFKIGTAGYIPRNFPNSSQEDWVDFFNSVPELGDVFGVYTAWNSPPLDDNGVPDQIRTGVELCRQNGLTPLIAVGYDIHEVNTDYFELNADAFQKVVLKAVEEYEPDYLSIGVEVNNLYVEHNLELFNEFVQFYNETYDLVKSISPNTKVFTIFQLEYMKGAAYYSGRTMQPNWFLINSFGDKLDLIGFTVYPSMNYNKLEDLPGDYLTSIKEYTGDKNIIISEMGWPTKSEYIIGSEETQVEFLNMVLNASKELNLEVLIQPFMHDFNVGIDIFEGIGLKNNNGSEKLLYNTWMELKKLN